ncbi:MAG: hypothetical protein QNJ46_21260, partial [Leptolyngbyaceae cyanobacterium MO_188.B28]|nr:hypothetical protein [Leptolyngbyaceae cyanobacterium MO_188.B28]
PYVNTDLFNQVLEDFAREFGVGQDKRIVLPVDQADMLQKCSLHLSIRKFSQSAIASARILCLLQNRLSGATSVNDR